MHFKKNSSRTLFPHQYITNYWLLQHGFSIGIGDTVANLKAAAAGEAEETTCMYPTMAKEAREPIYSTSVGRWRQYDWLFGDEWEQLASLACS